MSGELPEDRIDIEEPECPTCSTLRDFKALNIEKPEDLPHPPDVMWAWGDKKTGDIWVYSQRDRYWRKRRTTLDDDANWGCPLSPDEIVRPKKSL